MNSIPLINERNISSQRQKPAGKSKKSSTSVADVAQGNFQDSFQSASGGGRSRSLLKIEIVTISLESSPSAKSVSVIAACSSIPGLSAMLRGVQNVSTKSAAKRLVKNSASIKEQIQFMSQMHSRGMIDVHNVLFKAGGDLDTTVVFVLANKYNEPNSIKGRATLSVLSSKDSAYVEKFNQCLEELGKASLKVQVHKESLAVTKISASEEQLNQLRKLPGLKSLFPRTQVFTISSQPGYKNIDLFAALNTIRGEKGQDPIAEEVWNKYNMQKS